MRQLQPACPGLQVLTFIASSKNTVCDTVSFFTLSTFSRVYTCTACQSTTFTSAMPMNALFLTLIQHPAISSIMLSSRVHSAAVHWGAVRFVGSVRMRERYCVFDWVAEASTNV